MKHSDKPLPDTEFQKETGPKPRKVDRRTVLERRFAFERREMAAIRGDLRRSGLM